MRQHTVVKIIIYVFLAILLKTGVGYGYVSGPNPAKECAICHLNWIEVFYRKGQDAELAEYPKEKLVATEMMCYSCHDGSVVDSRFKVWETNRHKPGTKPSKKVRIPPNFPLDKEGRLQCATCHSAHGVDTRPGIEKTIFLRATARDSIICRKCHFDKDRGVKKGSHPVDVTSLEIPEAILKAGGKVGTKKNQIICQTCHEPHGSTSNYFLVIPNSGKGITHSALCETCHTKKPNIAEKSKRRRYSHPVDVPLPKEAVLPERWENGEKPYLSFDGRINCRTCHSPHNGTNDNHLLVDSNIKGRLCLYCHPSKKVVENSKHNLSITAPHAKNIDGKSAGEMGVCSACHLMHKGTGPKMWAREPGPGKDAIERLCRSCHKKGGVAGKKVVGSYSHPVGVDISVLGIKTDLPLYTVDGRRSDAKDKGRVVCTTCHNPHQWDPIDPERIADKDEEGDGSSSFLRKRALVQSDLCVECHKDKLTVESTKHDLKLTREDLKNIKGATVLESGVCGGCHLPHNGAGPKMWAREPGPGKDAIERLCRSCHKKGGVAGKKVVGSYSHPVGVDISVLGIKTDLPLYTVDGRRSDAKDKGRVVCTTCHDPHQWDPADAQHRGERYEDGNTVTSFLRKTANNQSQLCVSCHKDKSPIVGTKHDMLIMAKYARNIKGERPSVSGVCGGCHLPHNGTGIRMWARKQNADVSDPLARLCISCHNKKGLARKKLTGKMTHPVGIRMDKLNISITRDGWDSKFLKVLKGDYVVTLKTLPLFDKRGKRVRIKDGRVSCPTCHDPHIWDPSNPGPRAESRGITRRSLLKIEGNGSNSFLRLSNLPDSALCRNCHIEKTPVILTKHNLAISAPSARNTQGSTLDDSGICSSCHVPHNAKGPRLWARRLKNNKDVVKDMCESCHIEGGPAEGKTLNKGKSLHPTGVKLKPLMKNTDLPLFTIDGSKTIQNGRVLCITCHEPHQWDPEDINSMEGMNKDVEGNALNSFLRKVASPEPELCISCHKDKQWVRRTEHDMRITGKNARNVLNETVVESGVCGQCHAVHNSPNNILLWARELGRGDDIMEQLCRSCHGDDGLAATKLPYKLRHPRDVLIITSDKVKRNEEKRDVYFPLYNEEGRVTDAGFITCPTCHNPHQWQAGRKEYGPGRNIEGQAINSFLRNKSELSLCTDCHGMDALFRYKYFHGDISRQPYPLQGIKDY